MAAMFRRPRPAGGRHPPPLAPSVSSFKPRAQWNNVGSSIFLYVNLPGFYMDQIEIKKDEKTRTIQIQGERPLSAQTKARFNESYRVPESCNMTNLNTSFSHGLLTIEFQAVVEGEKQEKAVQDQGKVVQRSNQEKRGGPGPSNLGRKKTFDEEKQAGKIHDPKAAPMLNEQEPKTYKSVVEGKKAMPTGSREKVEPKVKAEEAIPSVRGKERVKEEKAVERKEVTQGQQKTGQKLEEEEDRTSLIPKVPAKEEKMVEKKEAAQIGQEKFGQKMKEEEAKSTPTVGGSLKPKVRAKEENATERKKDADISQNQNGYKAKEKEISGTPPIIDASLESKVHAKVVDTKGDVEIGQKLKEERKINLGQKKQEIYTNPVDSDEARRTDKKTARTNQAEPELKTKEGDERTELNVDDGLRRNQDQRNEMVGDIVSEGAIQEKMEQKKIEEAGLAKNTEDLKDNAEVLEPKNGPLLMEVGGRGMDEVESRTYDVSLVNVGVAALVIMGFGAYVFVPLVNLFT